MTKLKILFATFIFTSWIAACGSSESKKEATAPVPTQKLNYPFAYVDTKKEFIKNDNNYNEMLLYTCGDHPSIDSLRMFCTDKKKEFSDGIFHIVVFFDKKENAGFPNNPVTGGYIEELPSKHIKAVYTYNIVSGYSKLDYYDKNSWESTANTSEIY
jgi:hypothetical protein